MTKNFPALLVLAAAACISAAGTRADAQAPTVSAVPDLSGFWQHGVAAIDFASPPGGGPGPVQNTQSLANADAARNPIWVGNYKNPVLQPWTAEAVKHFGEEELAGRTQMTGTMLCQPSGVPNVHTLMGPMQILQAGNEVVLVSQRDHQVRTVYLNRQHAAHVTPSWYGESVGHYEGDTLVVDTIGLNDKTVVDRNGTPHSEALRVVERFRKLDGGKTMEVQFTVEDPKAFTMPWSAMVRYQRIPGQQVLEEEICAENDFDGATHQSFPIPTAAKPDF